MVEQRIDGVLAAVHQIDHALGQSDVLHQFKRSAW